tara:strand:- start:223 stop:525 length:303 start_codon:yes stop_codon:yes gene_type:complete
MEFIKGLQRIRDKEERIKEVYSVRNDFFLSGLDEDINPIAEGLAFPVVEESVPVTLEHDDAPDYDIARGDASVACPQTYTSKPTSEPSDPHAALLKALGL